LGTGRCWYGCYHKKNSGALVEATKGANLEENIGALVDAGKVLFWK